MRMMRERNSKESFFPGLPVFSFAKWVRSAGRRVEEDVREVGWLSKDQIVGSSAE